MERMNLTNDKTLGKLEDIAKIKEIIDDCFMGIYINKNWETGGGRDVLFLDNYVVKFPREDALDLFNGTTQNMKELEVYYNTRHKYLVPIYATHLGCLICKRVNDTALEVYINKFNLTELEAIDKLEADISVKIKELQPIINEYGLSANDIAKFNSWGYDKDLDDIVCLDYGLNLPSEKSYSKVLEKLDDKEIMDAYEKAYEIITATVRYEIPKLDSRATNEEIMGRIFKVSIVPLIGAKLIMQEVVRRDLAEFRKLDIEEVKELICKEIPNPETLESKVKDYNYFRTVTLDCFGFEVNIFKYNYQKAVLHLCKELFRYRLLIAFKK